MSCIPEMCVWLVRYGSTKHNNHTTHWGQSTSGRLGLGLYSVGDVFDKARAIKRCSVDQFARTSARRLISKTLLPSPTTSRPPQRNRRASRRHYYYYNYNRTHTHTHTLTIFAMRRALADLVHVGVAWWWYVQTHMHARTWAHQTHT